MGATSGCVRVQARRGAPSSVCGTTIGHGVRMGRSVGRVAALPRGTALNGGDARVGRRGRTSVPVCGVSVDSAGRAQRLMVEAKAAKAGAPAKGRVCQLLGKKRLNSSYLTFSHKKVRNVQYPNLQNKKVFWEEGQRWVKLRICTKAIKTLDKKGIEAMAKEAGLNLWELPHKKYDPSREKWKEENPYPAKQMPKRLKSRRKSKWLLPNSMRGEKAFVPEEESRPMVGEVINGRFVPKDESVLEEVAPSNLRVTRRIEEGVDNPFEDMQLQSLQKERPEAAEAAEDASPAPEESAKDDPEDEADS